MLSTVALVVAALSTGHKIGLGAVGAAFIVFALISSFVLPSRSPNFPGRHVGWYVVACVAFFVAMLAAVLVFGREKEEATAAEKPPTQTSAPPATTTSPSEGGGAPKTAGDPAAGKAVFASAGCAGCHTLKAAGSSGNVGPNLDELKPPEDVVRNQVTKGGGAMPAFKGQLSDKQIQDVAAFVFASTHS
jgi:mono/diheme cytochrome c family protein